MRLGQFPPPFPFFPQLPPDWGETREGTHLSAQITSNVITLYLQLTAEMKKTDRRSVSR